MKPVTAIFVFTSVLFVSCTNLQEQSETAQVVTPTASPQAQSPSPAPNNTVVDVQLQNEIAELAKEAKGKVGVYAIEVETGKSATLDENGHYAMQSVVKVPISMCVLKMVDEGKLKLDQIVFVQDTDMASTNQRSPIRDRSPQGTQMTVEDLIKDAIVESDGTASDVLQRVAGGAKSVQAYIDSIGVNDVKIVWSHKEFGLEWVRQYDNWLTARSAANLLQKLLSFSSQSRNESTEANKLTKVSADLLLRYMTESKNPDDRILGMLPKETVVAHKTGTGGTQDGITSATNDTAIITMPNGNHVVLAVLVGDSSGNHGERAGTIAKIAKAVFDKWSGVKPEPTNSANSHTQRKSK